MLQHLILGLLREQQQSYAYKLAIDHQRLSGGQANPGNMSKVLARLRDEGLVVPQSNAPGEDERRVAYAITAEGRRVLDDWLKSPKSLEEDFDTWLTFSHLISPETRDRLLERLQDELWLESKRINHAYEDALERRARGNNDLGNADLRLLRHRKQVTADLDFIIELRNGRPNGGKVES